LIRHSFQVRNLTTVAGTNMPVNKNNLHITWLLCRQIDSALQILHHKVSSLPQHSALATNAQNAHNLKPTNINCRWIWQQEYASESSDTKLTNNS